MWGVLSGAEVSAHDFERVGGFRQPALLKTVFAAFGPEVGARMATAMADEFDSPTRIERVIGLSEAAAFLAWALCGQSNASEMNLTACQVVRPEGVETIWPDDGHPLWSAVASTFGGYVWESLRIGAGVVPSMLDMSEALTVAVGCVSAGASVEFQTGGVTLILHFGGLREGDTLVAKMATEPNALRAIGANARALSVPAMPGSLAEQAQTSLAVDEAKFAVIH